LFNILDYFLKNKIILITGGSGSIGEAIVKGVIKKGVKSIKVFSNDENGLYELEEQFEKNKKHS